MQFVDKVAIVTGGAQGIGKSICSALLELGSKVCIADCNEHAAEAFITELSPTYKENVYFSKCDVSDYITFKGAFVNTTSKFGGVDILINNVGIIDEQNWRRCIDVTLVGIIHGIKLAFEYMSKETGNHGGRIINTSSVAGLSGLFMAPIYSCCKHGIIGLTRSYGSDYHFAKSGITVNAICPAATDTTMLRSFVSASLDQEAAGNLVQSLEKMLGASDVADAVIDLLRTDKNGAIWKVDTDGTKYC